jgi:branched-chain amino acid transport system permease protein
VLSSPFGLCLRAIREDEDLAEAQGLDLSHYKVTAYAMSGFLAGVAGALFAHYQSVLGPDNFYITYMAEMLVMVIVGGSGYVAGSIVGPLIFVTLPEVWRAVGELRLVLFGALLIVMVIWAPDGIVGRTRTWVDRIGGAGDAGSTEQPADPSADAGSGGDP